MTLKWSWLFQEQLMKKVENHVKDEAVYLDATQHEISRVIIPERDEALKRNLYSQDGKSS